MNKIFITVLLLSVLTLVACSMNPPVTQPVVSAPAQPSGASANVSNVTGPQTVEVNMTASRYSFVPDEIRIKQGDTLIIKVKSLDYEHSLSIPQLGVNLNLQPNDEKTVTIKADQKGTFAYSCQVFCGSGHSQMRGAIIVD